MLGLHTIATSSVTALKLAAAESCGPEGILQVLANIGRRSFRRTQVTPTATTHSVCMTAVQCHFEFTYSEDVHRASNVSTFIVVAVSRLQTVRLQN